MGKFRNFWNAHGSTVLTILSVSSAIATPILSAMATPKALQAIKEAEEQHYEDYIRDVDPDDGIEYIPLTTFQKVKVGIKHYITTIGVGLIGIVSSIGARAKDAKAINNITTAYNILSTSAQLFEQKVAENVTPDKLNKIRAAVAEEEIKGIEPPRQLYLESGDDKIAWFKDQFSKRFFRATTVKLETARNEINNTMLNEGFVSLNEWYIQLGLDPIDFGWDIGWHATIPGELMGFHVEYAAMDDGTPCGLVQFNVEPSPRVGKFA